MRGRTAGSDIGEVGSVAPIGVNLGVLGVAGGVERSGIVNDSG